MKLSQGMILADRYEIIERIGLGGMAVVYKAKDKKLERDVTVKVMREEYVLDEDFLKRFDIEARSAASLSNTNIVNVYDVGKEDDINFIVMEYIDGLTLKEIIHKKAPFENDELIGVTIQIAQALSHAHTNNIIHRDIKPQNIMVTKSGIVKVMDFGIAKAVTTSTTTTTSNSMGSVHYFSPEQAKGKSVDLRSDIYSLGIVMFEMATGELPFDGDSLVSVALKHINEPMPEISEFNPEISPAVERIIAKATNKLSSLRYNSIDEMINDLKRALKDSAHSKTMVYSGDKSDEYYDFDNLDDDLDEEEDYNDNRGKKSEKKVVIAAVATALAIVALIFAIFFRNFTNRDGTNNRNVVQMPSLTGLTHEQAIEYLLTFNIENLEVLEEHSDTFVAGLIISQYPDVGSTIDNYTEVTITISTGVALIPMPSVIGADWNERLDYDSQIPELLAHGLRVSVSYRNSEDYPENTVYDQDPPAGTMIEPGSSIRLNVSRGVQVSNVPVPNISGRTVSEARIILSNSSLILGEENRTHDNDVPEGHIIRQFLNPGSMVAQGTAVNVIVSLGPAEVEPDDSNGEDDTPDNNGSGNQDETPPVNSRTVTIPTPNILANGDVNSVSIRVVLHVGSQDSVLWTTDNATINDFPRNIVIEGEGLVAISVTVNGVLTAYDTINLDE